ncbi:MTH1187 family thiamine-binding protein [Geothermobacter hydrogeniphilus]|uniref:Thiamine-binding protein domain-containing protein n=1 Tax=Geothermobacter hydrogeniphilus TaxID=1969733 RepID=A0A1X0YEQ7_9BACT|nr:MTH1187 family thiamine-binding protein [Geothermobacter hydrogeniphilus]ORJ63609.1 hypothetical protein B5V00_01720 [Geothermobacter hydrogeniphilus]
MAIVEVSIAPLGTANPSVSAYVAECLRILRDSGLKHQLNPMGTVIEGDLDEILAVIAKMHEAPFAKGVSRVSTLIKIDDRRDSESHSMRGKVAVVTKLLDDS